MELVFKLEYCPVKKETFNIKVEKQKNKVQCGPFAYSNSTYSNHRKTFYTLYEKTKFVANKRSRFLWFKTQINWCKRFFLLGSRKSYSNRCLKLRHTIQHQVVCSDYFATLKSSFQVASDSHIWLHGSKNTHVKLRMAVWHQLLLYLTQGKQGKCAEVTAKFWLSHRGVFKTHMCTKWDHILQKSAKGTDCQGGPKACWVMGHESKFHRRMERGHYPPKGVTRVMWADRLVAEGSQAVIAANCCPGVRKHWNETKETKTLSKNYFIP